jgi:hypothetical protein
VMRSASRVCPKGEADAQFSRAVSGAYSPLFHVCWRHACGFVVHPRLASATPRGTFADQSVAVDRAVIRIKSAHKWPEEVILHPSQPTITPPVTMDPPEIQSSISPPPRDS